MFACRPLTWGIASALVGCALTMPAGAQPLLRIPGVPETPVEETAPEEPIAKKRAENAELLRVAQRKLDAASPTDAAAAQDVVLFKTVEAVLAQQEAVQTQIADLKARQENLQADLQAGRTGGADPSSPYSFLQFDQLKDELAAELARTAVVSDKVAAAAAEVEKAAKLADDRQRKRRLAQEALDTENTPETAAAAEQAVQAAKLAEETVNLRQLELDRNELARDVQQLAVQVLQEKAARIEPHVSFSEADLEQQLTAIDAEDAQLTQSLNRAEQRRASAQNDWIAAKRQVDAENSPELSEKLEAWRRATEKLQTQIELLNGQRQQLEQLRLVWKRRFQITNVPGDELNSSNELKTWQQQTKDALQELDKESRAQVQRLDLVRKDIATVAKKLDAAKDGPPEAVTWIERQRTHLENVLRLHEAHLVTIETTRRVHEKLAAEIGQHVQSLSLRQWAMTIWQLWVDYVWKNEVYRVDDLPITVQKLVTALLIFIIGLVVARMLAAWFASRMLKRVRLSKDATAVIKTLVFYALLVVVALVALKWANVPLTAFTILGGALAIGVGFGSQAIINNFLSGLIMLAERPVRLGEQVVFGKYEGVVEEVGFRSTKLRTATDHLVTIPNSSLINESIENVARRRTIRRLLNVTITYDTPREKVMAAVQAIRDILTEKGIREPIHPIVGFDESPPRVYFNDYNAESLNIQIVYWFAPPDWWRYMDHTERVNLRIMEEFERLGVEFAFPSRTLYLAGDVKRELAVRVVAEEAANGKAAAYE